MICERTRASSRCTEALGPGGWPAPTGDIATKTITAAAHRCIEDDAHASAWPRDTQRSLCPSMLFRIRTVRDSGHVERESARPCAMGHLSPIEEIVEPLSS